SFADSALINLHVNTTGLSQWTTYTTSFTIQTNDPANPSTIIPVILSLQGPLFSSEPASIDVEAETTDIKQDTLVLFNHGAIPLDFWISTSPVAVKATASSVPEWLSISQDSGTIAVGGSLPIVLTFDATNQAIGDYSTSLVIASNDSLTGTVTIPVDFHVATHTYRSVSVVPRWNLVSLPLRASSTAKDDIFPDAISEAYYFNGGYFSQSTLQLGRGYWLKFDSSQSYDVYGFLALEDSFTVTTDWNLIGCISNPIPVASITSNPPGMVTSEFYGYQDGYQIVDTLIPGQGYWVKVNESGKLYLSSSSTFSSATIRIVPMHQLPPPAPGEPDNNTTLIPTEFALEQNYPNPFNPTTVIRYQLSEPAYVTLNVYNTLGEEVARLVDEMQDAGYKMQTWDANGAPSGVYFYKLTVVGQDGILSYNDTKKMLLMR
ncbi:MAG: T9SS type A sorting domain-containing protein, partial [Bacteroidetes bacterium]